MSPPNASSSASSQDNLQAFNAEKIADDKRIGKLIREITVSFTKSHDLVQTAAMAVLQHAAPVAFGGKGYGDCTKAHKLARAVPARERNSLLAWFKLYSPIAITMAAKGSTKADNAKFRNENAADIVERGYVWNLDAANLDYWQADKQNMNPAPAALNMGSFWDTLTGLLDRTEKALEKKVGDKGTVYDDEAKARLKAAVPALRGIVNSYRAAEAKAANDVEDDEVETDEKVETETKDKEPVAAAA